MFREGQILEFTYTKADGEVRHYTAEVVEDRGDRILAIINPETVLKPEYRTFIKSRMAPALEV